MPMGQGRLFLPAIERHAKGHYRPRAERMDLRWVTDGGWLAASKV